MSNLHMINEYSAPVILTFVVYDEDTFGLWIIVAVWNRFYLS